MIKTFIYFPEDLNAEIERLISVANKSKAMIIREALKVGLSAIKKTETSGVEALLKIGELGKRINAKGPKDLSSKIDKYLWTSKK